MKVGKRVWVVRRDAKGAQPSTVEATIVEYSKGATALVRFESGREVQVAKVDLSPKPPKGAAPASAPTKSVSP